ncbi:hypothetical protein UCRPC4_g06410 [Phaeomoniella chlamydospora]|uniref:YAG7-like dimerisation domain-containing protein n=1 Tax=Phaeomoniella chlamydospora TaxID=158046 RepID=A0A0G2DX31_PHACM|nr:hypothetical protein UCRPC4_g06410 [Phaeomoniella chlamydospora]
MSSSAPLNGAAAAESKSAKKRKAKATNTAPATDGSSTPVAEVADTPTTNGADHESPILKELQKNLRNANKKLAASAKAQSIVDENPGISLNDLVASKKINTDQKAQIERRPALHEQVKSLEQQLDRYRQFGKDYEDRFEQEKSAIKQSHDAEVARIKQEAADEAAAKASSQQDADLLVLTQFLHAASSKRNDESTPALEGKAFEGVLLKIYQGSREAIADMKKLVNGDDSKVTSIENEELDFTFAQVKQLSISAVSQITESAEEVAPIEERNAAMTGSDPTVVHAGLTELEDNVTVPVDSTGAPETSKDEMSSAVPEQASVDAGAGNAVAEASWDATASLLAGDSWVEVPRNPAETDTGLTATPADAAPNTNSWAEEANEGAEAQAKLEADNEGFETVQHHHHPRERGRGRGRGESRPRGRGGDSYRGRGRGDGERRGGGGRGRGRNEGGQGRGGRGGRGRDTQTGGRQSE